MNITRFVQKQARLYPKRSFEEKIFFGIILYFVFILTFFHNLFTKFIQRINLKRVPTRPLKKQERHITFATLTKLKYVAVGSFLSLCFIFIPVIIFIFLQDLPSPTELTERPLSQTTKIYDRNGKLLTEVYAAQDRTLVPLSAIPETLQNATLAIEDKNFYKHPGFDIPAMIRAAKEDISGGRFQGGSTITQQLIKSSILTPEQTFSRKLKEVILAFWAERIYTKQQILEMYFNQIPYGGTAWGVEAASEVYFGKSVKNLNLSESAFLAGITQAPTTYSPFGKNPDLWKKRQKEVLTRMATLGYISKKTADTAYDRKLAFKKQQAALHAPHFVTYIKSMIAEKYGIGMLEKGGLRITTTLDLSLQEIAQQTVTEEIAKSAYLHVTNGAALVTNPQNGDILAMVGSSNFDDPNGGNVNLTTSLRQPGSSIKIVTYSKALTDGYTAASIIEDSPQTFRISDTETYTPVNYDGAFHGRVTLRAALANSYNIPAVKILQKITVSNMLALGKKMGITSWKDPDAYGLSLTLGGGEVTMIDMARVNGTLANQGNLIDLNPIIKITDYKDVVFESKETPQPTRVIPASVAFIISNILADNLARSAAFGLFSPLSIPNHTVSVKTGTSDNKRDNWTNGYTNNAVVIAWVGNNDNTPMSPSLASGITGAAPIWHRIMENLLTKNPEKAYAAPADVVLKFCLGKNEYFVRGTENTTFCGPQVNPSLPFTSLPPRGQQNLYPRNRP